MGLREHLAVMAGKHSNGEGGVVGWVFRIIFRTLQFTLALTVAGIYGIDIHHARVHGEYGDSRWVYAEVVAALSACTCLFYLTPTLKTTRFFAWDMTLFILWVAVFGNFARLYLHAKAYGNSGIQRMKNAVWVDLTNMLLWFITGAVSAVIASKEARNPRKVRHETI